MKIDLTKLKKKSWFEDAKGNEVSSEDPRVMYYKSCFPLKVHKTLDEYCYHPTNPIIKFLSGKIPGFYNFISKNKPKTFKTIFDSVTTYSGGQDCIVAMVNSGDYTLEEAVYIWVNSCERCSNVLENKYLGKEYGYPEYSDKWKKCNTECDFCGKEVKIDE